ncbi:MAG: hypothetical protein M3137_07700, partial [Actinomycetota bacterium]|nr:hypothetical protein [Actinomycetota bacterium]
PGCAPAPATSSSPSVVLPPAGGNLTQTDADGTLGQVGPATFFSSGALTTSTQGTTGSTGSVTSSVSIATTNTSTQEGFTASNVASTCTASASTATGSTTITGGTLQVDSGDDTAGNVHAPVDVPLPPNPAPNTAYTGHIHVNGTQEEFRYVFNEQVVDPDGSITVNAAHEYLLGPTAIGELIIGQSRCGVDAARDVISRVSTDQYTLTGSDGTTWQPMDPAKLSMVVRPATAVNAVITANADLFTYNAGFNQDIAVFVDGTLRAWKESGGFAGIFSPNAATVTLTMPLAAGPHTVDIRWKTNKPDPGGKISAGAGPINGAFSPTRLTALLVPVTSTTSVATAASTDQYTLASSDGATWQPMDPAKLSTTVNPTATMNAVVTANADLFTYNSGFNQDIAVFVDGTLRAWKESGGFAGIFSPNAATVTLTMPLAAGPHTIDIRWKTNKPDPGGKISAGAGPINGAFSPTRLTALLVPIPA